jgi:hypothetical protein
VKPETESIYTTTKLEECSVSICSLPSQAPDAKMLVTLSTHPAGFNIYISPEDASKLAAALLEHADLLNKATAGHSNAHLGGVADK